MLLNNTLKFPKAVKFLRKLQARKTRQENRQTEKYLIFYPNDIHMGPPRNISF